MFPRMSRIEELPDDFDDAIDLNKNFERADEPPAASGVHDEPVNAPGIPEALYSQTPAFPVKPSIKNANDAAASQPSAALPPGMESVKSYTADEVLTMMNRTPLFMTSLDETDGEEGENVELEAIKALLHDGTKAEVAGNFREQGNEQARAKHWTDAKEFYDKALAALRAPEKEGERLVDSDGNVVDPKVEARRRKEIEEASLVNRALCNLEKSTQNTLFHSFTLLRINFS